MPTIFVLNGPNLNLLGVREPATYGYDTLADVEQRCIARGNALDLTIEFRQTNHEGQLVDWIQEARDLADGIVLNAGALTHTSVAILDALNAAELPVIEVHLSNIFRREQFRHHSYVSLAARGVICGLGPHGYELALEALANLIEAEQETADEGGSATPAGSRRRRDSRAGRTALRDRAERNRVRGRRSPHPGGERKRRQDGAGERPPQRTHVNGTAHHSPEAAEPAAAAEAAPASGHGTRLDDPGPLTAPLVGVAYLAPTPGAAPFVRIGDPIEKGQTLLIIEAMKVMNQIRAPRAGRLARILSPTPSRSNTARR